MNKGVPKAPWFSFLFLPQHQVLRFSFQNSPSVRKICENPLLVVYQRIITLTLRKSWPHQSSLGMVFACLCAVDLLGEAWVTGRIGRARAAQAFGSRPWCWLAERSQEKRRRWAGIWRRAKKKRFRWIDSLRMKVNFESNNHNLLVLQECFFVFAIWIDVFSSRLTKAAFVTPAISQVSNPWFASLRSNEPFGSNEATRNFEKFCNCSAKSRLWRIPRSEYWSPSFEWSETNCCPKPSETSRLFTRPGLGRCWLWKSAPCPIETTTTGGTQFCAQGLNLFAPVWKTCLSLIESCKVTPFMNMVLSNPWY